MTLSSIFKKIGKNVFFYGWIQNQPTIGMFRSYLDISYLTKLNLSRDLLLTGNFLLDRPEIHLQDGVSPHYVLRAQYRLDNE